MTSIAIKLDRINAGIRQAEIDAQRVPFSTQLLAVSKTKPAADIIKAYRAGQRQFGESYLQEALLKQKELCCYQICWHFIGPIQSNKTRQIAAHFSWVHSVDRLKIAKRLNEQRPDNLPPLNICLQVNISNEQSKSGFQLEELAGAVEQVLKLTNLKLRGVMAIPQPATEYELQCEPYHQLYQAAKALNKPEMDTFSFGMTGDVKAAIAEGSTIVRVGTALFGRRSG
ncbi:PLP dependent protein [Bathymodiolus platifrons methanotrophic gill symbiont]|uniref:YggS family pyridoxal phosphate-dependent enzyme n=1 Tax=Bathymodiolus platifrons methanotrophic gill symbiont TaxID=113268 RepID=UPI0011C95125|nr:YggS family pyridoxal phosphate-dependent enzyme [Bathymodiolus platifrons methanotrophic gill symbiont]TXK93082.1 YggS family pyridoxal phosphate-dependent enzyme [Methylococcaceae bacterium HT1]TXL17376.1 YggS family pyridoxal phosphate-dependent enzyme [Methylococcaceae bacterium HT3]TXL23016.1 YggS family pyridoxal phosphate-dependent enzyme [Methylococcaceae bacterium HT2]TXL17378.1 YggS family pyridoxal phosphate-dependent enzyme [Methylococcaceae bacterium HT3]GFO74077.1 PLP dependen